MRLPPPIDHPITFPDGSLTPPWILYYNSNFEGDAGTVWTPTFTSLGATGTPVLTGKYYRLSQKLTYFTVTVTPDTDTTCTAGVTYIDNFPLLITANGAVLAVAGVVGSEDAGIAIAGNNRIYPPGWTGITVPVTICGLVEAT